MLTVPRIVAMIVHLAVGIRQVSSFASPRSSVFRAGRWIGSDFISARPFHGHEPSQYSLAALRAKKESDDIAANISIKDSLAQGKLSRLRIIVDPKFREILRLEKRRRAARLFLDPTIATSLFALRTELAEYLSLPPDAFLLQVNDQATVAAVTVAADAEAGTLDRVGIAVSAHDGEGGLPVGNDTENDAAALVAVVSTDKELAAAWAAAEERGLLVSSSALTNQPSLSVSSSSSSSTSITTTAELRLLVAPNPLVEWPPVAPYLRNMPDPALTPAFQMLSFYSFKPVADPDAFADTLQDAWASVGALGRAYVSAEGVNAQMAVPSSCLEAFTHACALAFASPAAVGKAKVVAENGGADSGSSCCSSSGIGSGGSVNSPLSFLKSPPRGLELNLDVEVPAAEFQAMPAFRALHVRAREQIVSDGFSMSSPPPTSTAAGETDAAVAATANDGVAAGGVGLRLPSSLMFDDGGEDTELPGSGGGGGASLIGEPLTPEQWHEALEDIELGKAKNLASVVLDCRNEYESDIGRFEHALPLNTTTFKDTWASLDKALEGKPKDTEVLTYCTGGIRCVKVGAYLTQTLGFTNVKRLEGGIVNYTQHFKRKCAAAEEAASALEEGTATAAVDFESVSKFRGLNYVFNDRMAEVITLSRPGDIPVPGSRDRRSVEARALVMKRAKLQARVEQQQQQQQQREQGGQRGDNEEGGKTSSSTATMAAGARAAVATRAGHTEQRPRVEVEEVEDALDEYCSRQTTSELPLLSELRLLTEATMPRACHMTSGHVQGQLLAMLTKLCGAKRVLEVGTFTGYSALCFANGGAAHVTTLEIDPAAAAMAQSFFDRSEFGSRIQLVPGPAMASLQAFKQPPLPQDQIWQPEERAHHNGNLDGGEVVETVATSQEPPPPPRPPRPTRPFDLVFLDADKRSYGKYLDALLDGDDDLGDGLPQAQRRLVREGTLILVDNVLWKGKVLGCMSTSGPPPPTSPVSSTLGEEGNSSSRKESKEEKAARRDRVLTQAMHEFNVKVRKDKRLEQVVLPLRDGISIIRVVK